MLQTYSPTLHYLLLIDVAKLENFSKVVQVKDSVKRELAIRNKLDSLEKNINLVLTQLPDGKKALQNKWVFRVIKEPNAKKRYEARVVKGF